MERYTYIYNVMRKVNVKEAGSVFFCTRFRRTSSISILTYLYAYYNVSQKQPNMNETGSRPVPIVNSFSLAKYQAYNDVYKVVERK